MGRRVCVRAVLGAVVMAVALGVASGLGSRWDMSGRILPALVCSAMAVPAILLLRARLDRRSVAGLGLTGPRESVAAFGLGVAVTGGSAVLLLGGGTVAGWIEWRRLDPADLLLFVVSNGVVALLLEALPEELTLRGYTWAALREKHRGLVAALGTTGLFLLVPGAASVIQSAIDGSRPGLVPSGEDPVGYLVLLTVFGLTLVAARTATRSASLWTCIGTHLTFLTVNRVTLYGDDRDAGWSADLVEPDAILLIPAYLIVAAVAYRLLSRRLPQRQRG